MLFQYRDDTEQTTIYVNLNHVTHFVIWPLEGNDAKQGVTFWIISGERREAKLPPARVAELTAVLNTMLAPPNGP